MFPYLILQWKYIYTLPRITTIDSKLRCFQYKVLHSTYYIPLSKAFFISHTYTPVCSFCNLEDETVIHLFVHCSKTTRLSCKVLTQVYRFGTSLLLHFRMGVLL